MDLKSMLEEMSSMQEEPLRRRLLASARMGARLALQRVRVVGSSYVTGADLTLVEQELDGITPQAPVLPVPPVPPEAPVAPPFVNDDDLVSL